MCRIALLDPDSPDYILGKGRVSANGMEMEILPRSSWRARGEGILNTWLPASTLFQWRCVPAAWCRRSSHYITDYLASGLGNGEWRRICRTESQLPGPGANLIDQ